MNNNQKFNQMEIRKFRKELSAMFEDISTIDVKCLNKAVNIGLADAKQNTPIGQYSSDVKFTTKNGDEVNFSTSSVKVGGFMRKSWNTSPTLKTAKGAEKELFNSMDYSSYVNYGHRIVNRKGETVGFVKGKFMLDKAIHKVDKALQKEFGKEVERVNKEHDK